jgi:hypothetical protein
MGQPEFAHEWLRQRLGGAEAVARVEAEELAALDDATALAQAEALLAAVPLDALAEGRVAWSGLVEQQRAFQRGRVPR